jgi:hypothetical protein
MWGKLRSSWLSATVLPHLATVAVRGPQDDPAKFPEFLRASNFTEAHIMTRNWGQGRGSDG